MNFKMMKKLSKEFANKFDFVGNNRDLDAFNLTTNDVKFITKEFIKFLKANELAITLELEDFEELDLPAPPDLIVVNF
jgi:hypothetical protein